MMMCVKHQGLKMVERLLSSMKKDGEILSFRKEKNRWLFCCLSEIIHPFNALLWLKILKKIKLRMPGNKS